MSERENLELAACELFVPLLNELRSTTYAIAKHQDRPDFVIKDDSTESEIGVEVSHLFYDRKEAKMRLGRGEPKKPHGVMNSNTMIAELNHLLQKKASDALEYSFDGQLFLLIRVASVIYDKGDFEMYIEDIVVPCKPFVEIWLLAYAENPVRKAWALLKLL